ncbi:hypothetical protein BV22DRAFT_1073441 [Leucogyrophana mollusca]|uniref:Uncharacterized protein n=1 Tax=Leucogyrophana mollusca TaxID=85980 RepID=A0ACB8B4Q0_9AGAM|nr:hypothetical protein BV22DRAFT_1073441 [Leucogyrophana mollusca]
MHYHIDSPTATVKDFAAPGHSSRGPSHSRHEAQSPSQWSEASWGSSPRSPVPIPHAPHLRNVSLPHPNAAPRHPSYDYDDASASGPPSGSVVALHPLLSYDPNARMRFNVAQDLSYIQLRPGCSPRMLQELALSPSAPRLLITFPSIPAWPIEVANPRGVTVTDVLGRIRDVLNRPVTQHELVTQFPWAATSAAESFRARTRADPGEYAQGVKRLDIIGPNYFFVGLTRARDGQDRWDIHFSASA